MPLIIWIKPILIAAATIGSAKILAHIHKDTIDRFAMGFFRDIGRYKAKKRRNLNSKGLISTLMQQDDLNEEMKLILNPDDEDQTDLPTYTDTELYEFGNGHDGKPLLLGILGHVYDVSAGSKFYGEKGDYAAFAGHDVTYSLGTGCKAIECVQRKAVDTFTEKELNEAKRWLSFFHLHDKYKIVGKIESNYVDILLDDLIAKNTEPVDENDLAKSASESEGSPKETTSETSTEL